MPTPYDRWTSILRDVDSSGLTAAKFFARRKLSRANFRRWRKRLGHERPPAFTRALPPTSASGVFSLLTVELRYGRRIAAFNHFDDLTFARVILLLERIDRLDALAGVTSRSASPSLDNLDRGRQSAPPGNSLSTSAIRTRDYRLRIRS